MPPVSPSAWNTIFPALFIAAILSAPKTFVGSYTRLEGLWCLEGIALKTGFGFMKDTGLLNGLLNFEKVFDAGRAWYSMAFRFRVIRDSKLWNLFSGNSKDF